MAKKTKKDVYKCLMKISTSENRAQTDLIGTLRIKEALLAPTIAFSIPIGMTLKASRENSQIPGFGIFCLMEFHFLLESRVA